MNAGKRMFKRTKTMMGTFVTVSFEHYDQSEASKIMQHTFKEMQSIVDLLNNFDENSEISRLNQQGFLNQASPETLEVIHAALSFSALSGGTFDITVLPLVELWKDSAEVGVIPSDAEIASVSELVDYRNIIVANTDIRFSKPGMRVVLGAIAKGYVVDKAIECLIQAGMERAIVNGGGDIRVLGGNDEKPWRIGVKDPKNNRHIITALSLRNEAVATSGTYQRDFCDLINPKSGKPAGDILSATVVSSKAMDADMIATCIYVLGVDKGMDLLESLREAWALVVSKDGKIYRSHSNGGIVKAQVEWN